MAKVSMIEREKRRARTVEKYAAKRAELKATISNVNASDEELDILQTSIDDVGNDSINDGGNDSLNDGGNDSLNDEGNSEGNSQDDNTDRSYDSLNITSNVTNV